MFERLENLVPSKIVKIDVKVPKQPEEEAGLCSGRNSKKSDYSSNKTLKRWNGDSKYHYLALQYWYCLQTCTEAKRVVS